MQIIHDDQLQQLGAQHNEAKAWLQALWGLLKTMAPQCVSEKGSRVEITATTSHQGERMTPVQDRAVRSVSGGHIESHTQGYENTCNHEEGTD